MQITTRKSDKAQQMIDYLQEVIHAGRLKPGEKIPSLRNLNEQFGISLGTAKRGIDYLCQKGLLESNRGSGTFVASTPLTSTKNAAQRIIVLIPWTDSQSGILHTLYSGILEENTGDQTQLMLSHVAINDLKKSAIKTITHGCSGLIMLGEYDLILQNNLNIKMPVVGCVIHSNLDGTASLFEMDPYQSADIAVEYFKRKNISHVKCYTSISPVFSARSEQFKSHWIKSGGTIEYNEITSNTAAGECKFEPNGAFLFSSGWLMNMFCKRSEVEFGVQLTKSAAILGLDGRSCVDPHFYQAPTIYTDWKQMGRDIYIECMRRVKEPGVTPRRYYYPVELIEPKQV
jgi:DNA-binding transcriptional regulator YhcF (GntR family)